MHLDSARRKDPRDQQTAMANRRVFFATKKSDASIAAKTALQPFDSPEEEVGVRHLAVKNVALGIVELFSLRPPAQFFAHVHVANTGFLQPALNAFAIKMRTKARVRLRSGVGDDVYLELPEEFHKPL